jgi:surface protein
MAIFSFINRSSGSAYFVLETVPNSQEFFDSSSLKGAWGAYYNFTGSIPSAKVSSNYVFGYVAPPGSSSFEYNPTDYIPTGSVYFIGTRGLIVTVTGEVTSSVYDFGALNGAKVLNTVPIENVYQATWDTTRTTAGSSTSTQLVLPLLPAVSSSLYNFVITWGDNTSSSISSSLQPEVTHSYASSGTYTTKMWGTMRGWRFNNTGDRNKLQSVDKWGGLRFTPNVGLAGIFRGCNSASFSNVVGVPDLSYTNTLNSLFWDCQNLTTVNNLEKWDIGRITDLGVMFFGAYKFDQNIGSWDVSNNTNFNFTFGCSATNPDPTGIFNNGGSPSIGNWNTARVTNMGSMFQNQLRFNQNIGSWDVSNVTTLSSMFSIAYATTTPWQTMSGSFNNGGSPSIGNWNTGRVTNMSIVFSGQYSFDQNIGNWDTSKVTTFANMFTVANPTPTFTASLHKFNNGNSPLINNWDPSKGIFFQGMFRDAGNFNQPIGGWNVSSSTNFTNFMTNKTFNDYSSTNYDALLNGWILNGVKPNISINFGTIKYSSASSASRAVLTSAPNNWTIVDGGQLP